MILQRKLKSVANFFNFIYETLNHFTNMALYKESGQFVSLTEKLYRDLANNVKYLSKEILRKRYYENYID